jgi:hypothetical protein
MTSLNRYTKGNGKNVTNGFKDHREEQKAFNYISSKNSAT